jgi:DNA uptake protein ComE-like DNA-binding protein
MNQRAAMFRPLLLPARPSRRGSAILIVLALLSVLVLLAMTLAFTSRLEVTSSKNFERAVQNRTAAITGVERVSLAAAAALESDGAASHVAFALAAAQATPGARQFLEKAPAGAERDRALLRAAVAGIQTGSATVAFEDASARLNINTATAAELTLLFEQIAGRSKTIGSVDPAALAERIVAWRLGPDGAPGAAGEDDNKSAPHSLAAERQRAAEADRRTGKSTTLHTGAPRTNLCPGDMPGAKSGAEARAFDQGVDEDDEYEADLRRAAFGDDRRFTSVDQLAGIKGMTPRFLAELERYLTPFSAHQSTVRTAKALNDSPLDLNRATALEIFEALRLNYDGAKDENLLRQFAVNIVDARDADRRRTSLPDASGRGVVLGLERVPFLTEVMANTLSDDAMGDDGQFVEIYNPWPEPIGLAGWRLRVGSVEVPLSGVLPPRGFLIVTDDADNRNDPAADRELKGTGSLYDLFGIVDRGPAARVIEDRRLDIPHGRGTHRIDLLDDAGALADRFTYVLAEPAGPLRSLQRPNILLDEAILHEPTPMALAPLDPTLTAETTARLREVPRDAPFTTTLQLLEVFAGYVAEGGRTGARWSFPVLAHPAAVEPRVAIAAGDRRLIDARVLDWFTVESVDRPSLAEQEDLKRRTLDPAKAAKLGEADERRLALAPRGAQVGRVNINTASYPVLVAVGFTPVQAETILRRRAQLEQNLIAGTATAPALYQSMAEVLTDSRLWGSIDPTAPCSTLAQAAPIMGRLTTRSSTFFLEGQARAAAASPQGGTTGSRVQALVLFEAGSPHWVSWRFDP